MSLTPSSDHRLTSPITTREKLTSSESSSMNSMISHSRTRKCTEDNLRNGRSDITISRSSIETTITTDPSTNSLLMTLKELSPITPDWLNRSLSTREDSRKSAPTRKKTIDSEGTSNSRTMNSRTGAPDTPPSRSESESSPNRTSESTRSPS